MKRFRAGQAIPLLTALILSAPLLAQELPRAVPEEVGMSSERLHLLSGTLQGYVDEGRLPGAVVMVLRRGKIVYSEAFGHRDREAEAQMTTDAIFRIASQTKALVSVGIMMLQEEGELLISDSVSKHLPAFANTSVAIPTEAGGYDVVEASREIRVRDLLTHTAGIGYGGGPGSDRWSDAEITGWYFAHRDEPVRTTVDRIAGLPFPAQPGAQWVYGYNTDILGAVIEAVSGQTLDVFLQRRILDPLNMRDTHFYLPGLPPARQSSDEAPGTPGASRLRTTAGTAQDRYGAGVRRDGRPRGTLSVFARGAGSGFLGGQVTVVG